MGGVTGIVVWSWVTLWDGNWGVCIAGVHGGQGESKSGRVPAVGVILEPSWCDWEMVGLLGLHLG